MKLIEYLFVYLFEYLLIELLKWNWWNNEIGWNFIKKSLFHINMVNKSNNYYVIKDFFLNKNR